MKVIKAVLKWRRRYYQMRLLKESFVSQLSRIRESLNIAQKRYDHLLRHNVYLAKEIDNLNNLIDSLEATNDQQ